MNKKKRVYKNIIMMYILNGAKIVLPLVVIPYLTRVLSVEMYGGISFVKACIAYCQMFVDFGFMLSATKDIIDSRDEYTRNCVITETTVNRIILSIIAFIVFFLTTLSIDIMKGIWLFSLLSFIPIFFNIFLFDFFFRAIEKMEVITYRFVISKLISTIVIIVFITSDADIIIIPIADILSSIVVVLMTFKILKTYKCKLVFNSIESCISRLKKSGIYFLSDVSSTFFNTFNTVIIGIITSAESVAIWNICMQIIMGIQALYSPVSTALYPYMLRTRNFKFIVNMLCVGMVFVFVGSYVLYQYSNVIITTIVGGKYMVASQYLNLLIPVVVFSFPAMMLEWPVLGAVNKIKEITISTITAGTIQLFGVSFLMLSKQIALDNIVFVRCVTEISLFLIRLIIIIRFRKCFTHRKCGE